MWRGIFFGIGSNLDPMENIPRITVELLHVFGEIRYSPVIRTDPVGIQSDNFFLNLAGYLETRFETAKIKGIFNSIEEKIGRNRNDPDKKNKDRVADIDILCTITPQCMLSAADVPRESYFRPCFEILAETIGKLPYPAMVLTAESVDLQLAGQHFGEAVCIIRRNPQADTISITPFQTDKGNFS